MYRLMAATIPDMSAVSADAGQDPSATKAKIHAHYGRLATG
jgi:hypothetical protein